MKVIIQIFVGTLCIALIGQSYIQASLQYHHENKPFYIILS